VDGNDVFAVWVAAAEALARARSGGGPTLIEAVTYRIGDHTTADDASRYRSDEEVASWQARDPITRLRRYLETRGLWDDAHESELEEQVHAWVDEQVHAFEAMPAQSPEDLFTHMYAQTPLHLQEQMAALLEEVRG
jgi:TPP-dependent pyruvate/acetoin dehydrogenase alpha subunit